MIVMEENKQKEMRCLKNWEMQSHCFGVLELIFRADERSAYSVYECPNCYSRISILED